MRLAPDEQLGARSLGRASSAWAAIGGESA